MSACTTVTEQLNTGMWRDEFNIYTTDWVGIKYNLHFTAHKQDKEIRLAEHKTIRLMILNQSRMSNKILLNLNLKSLDSNKYQLGKCGKSVDKLVI